MSTRNQDLDEQLKLVGTEEYNNWVTKYYDKLKNYSEKQVEYIFKNSKFIETFGKDAFDNVPDINDRDKMYHDYKVQEQFDKEWSPFFEDSQGNEAQSLWDPNKGLGEDYFKASGMTVEGQEELLRSSFLSPNDLAAKQQEDHEKMLRMIGNPSTEHGINALQAYLQSKEAVEKNQRDLNQKIFDDIYARDLKRKTQKEEIKNAVSEYKANNIDTLDDETVNKLFMSAIKDPQGPKYIYSAYFNDEGLPIESETENFTMEEKREFLAKRDVYSKTMDPQSAFEALNNEATEYISDHQSVATYTGLLAKDICIGVASYTADKWNSVRRAPLAGQEAQVYQTPNNQIVPNSEVLKIGDNAYHISKKFTEEGESILNSLNFSNDFTLQNATPEELKILEDNELITPVHQVTMDKLTLDDLGYDGEGNRRHWFNNAQFWNDAERFGTMDEEELEQWKNLGYSPHKVVYKPGDSSDILYGALRSTCFALADQAMMFLPTGAVSAGLKMLGTASKVTQAIGAATKAIGTVGSAVQPVLSATGMGRTTGRSLFGETYEKGLTDLEGSISARAQKEIHDLYNTNEDYKTLIDDKIDSLAQKMLEEQMNLSQETGRVILDPEAQKEILKNYAAQKVFENETKAWEDNYKSSQDYSNDVAKVATDASDGAYAAAVVTSFKGLAANYGWRKYLFKTPKELSEGWKTASPIEVYKNAAGKNRLKLADFSKRKAFYRAVGEQFTGEAGDEMLDELIISGGKRITSDRTGLYLDGLYDGLAAETMYTTPSMLTSFVSGFQEGMGDKQTWESGLVGAISPFTNFAVNFSSIASPQFKNRWKNASFGEKVNMLFSNGVLSEYYAQKTSHDQLNKTVAVVNEILENENDFSDIREGIAIDLAINDADSEGDRRALNYIKAVRSLAVLTNLQSRAEEDDQLKEVLGHVGTVDDVMGRLNSIVEESYDEQEKSELLSEYYANNTSVPQSPENDTKALEELKNRAETLISASQDFAEISDRISRKEKATGRKFSKAEKSALLSRYAFKAYYEKRAQEIKDLIGVDDSYLGYSDEDFKTYGSAEFRSSLINTLNDDANSIMELILETEKEIESLESTERDTEEDTETSEKIAQKKLVVNRYNEILQKLSDLRIKLATEGGNTIFSSEEILQLNAASMNRMLDADNADMYSQEQLVEIEKARQALLEKRPEALNELKELDKLSRLNYALSSNLNSDHFMDTPFIDAHEDMIGVEARIFHNNIYFNSLRTVANKLKDECRIQDMSDDQISTIVYQNLRVLKEDTLKSLIARDDFQDMRSELEKALEFSNLTDDVYSALNNTEGSEEDKKFITQILDEDILPGVTTKEDFLNAVSGMVERLSADEKVAIGAHSFIDIMNNILNSLEQVWEQKASTTKMTSEERNNLIKDRGKKIKEENEKKEAIAIAAKKKAETERIAKEEEERIKKEKEKEEKDKEDPKKEEKETSNEEGLSAEDIAKGLAGAQEVDLEDSPDAEEDVRKAGDVEGVNISSSENFSSPKIHNTTRDYLGNAMYGYDLTALQSGKLKKRKGATEGDSMDKFFKWLEKEGIHLQDIIDREILAYKSMDVNLHPIAVTHTESGKETDDFISKTYLFLGVEYTEDVARVHDEKLGGVIHYNGKKYLIVGVSGFGKYADSAPYFKLKDKVNAKKNTRQKDNERKGIKRERFFVDTETIIKIDEICPGKIVTQLEGDPESKLRSISDLLEEKRNPEDLELEDLVWGIVRNNGDVITINADPKTQVLYKTSMSNGSVILYTKTNNGDYVPTLVRVSSIKDLKDGRLKDEIVAKITNLSSVDYNNRREALLELRELLHLDKNKATINIGNSNTNVVSVVINGETAMSVNLEDSSINVRAAIQDMILNAGFLLNINTSTLKNTTTLRKYIEAGALKTTLASLQHYNAYYTIKIESDGNTETRKIPIDNAANNSTTTEIKSTNIVASVRLGRWNYSLDDKSVWRGENGASVTNADMIIALNALLEIQRRGLKPFQVYGISHIFILDADRDNPRVFKYDLDTRSGTPSYNNASYMTANAARGYVDRYWADMKEKEEEAARAKEAARLKELESQEQARLLEQANKGETVNLDDGDELTEEQIKATLKDINKQMQYGIDGPSNKIPNEELGDEKKGNNTSETVIIPSDESKNNINSIGDTSLTSLMGDKELTTAVSIMKSGTHGSKVRKLLKSKFPELFANKTSIEDLVLKLEEKGIPIINISDPDKWLKLIEDCR